MKENLNPTVMLKYDFPKLNDSENCIITLYNVCSVHRGVFSTLGGYEYIRGCSVHWGDMSTSGGVQYIEGTS